MIEKFRPTKYYANIFDVDFEKLKEEGIKVVASDLDNTLVPHDVKLPDERVKNLIEHVESLGMKFIIVSNNHGRRVREFCLPLGIEYYYNSRKPLPFVFKMVLKEYKINKDQLVLIGDQLMTDVFGSNSLHIKSIYVDPLAKKDLVYTKLNRKMEAKVMKDLEKISLFKKGHYYD